MGGHAPGPQVLGGPGLHVHAEGMGRAHLVGDALLGPGPEQLGLVRAVTLQGEADVQGQGLAQVPDLARIAHVRRGRVLPAHAQGPVVGAGVVARIPGRDVAQEDLLAKGAHAHEALVAQGEEDLPAEVGDLALVHARLEHLGQDVVQGLVVALPGQAQDAQFVLGLEALGQIQDQVPAQEAAAGQALAEHLAQLPGQGRDLGGQDLGEGHARVRGQALQVLEGLVRGRAQGRALQGRAVCALARQEQGLARKRQPEAARAQGPGQVVDVQPGEGQETARLGRGFGQETADLGPAGLQFGAGDHVHGFEHGEAPCGAG